MPRELDDAKSLSDDLSFLERLLWFRMSLQERLCKESAASDEAVLQILRQEPTQKLAEFLFLLQARQVETVGQIDRMAELHNEYIVRVTKDVDKMKRLGLTEDRLLQCIFTSDTRPRLIENWQQEQGAIDQSNLARFLGAVMSAETCRKVVVACAKAKYLRRTKTPYGTFLIKSEGALEQIFAQTLREARIHPAC